MCTSTSAIRDSRRWIVAFCYQRFLVFALMTLECGLVPLPNAINGPTQRGGYSVRDKMNSSPAFKGSYVSKLKPCAEASSRRERQSTFHPHAQRNAFRRRGAHLQQRLFARWN